MTPLLRLLFLSTTTTATLICTSSTNNCFSNKSSVFQSSGVEMSWVTAPGRTVTVGVGEVFAFDAVVRDLLSLGLCNTSVVRTGVAVCRSGLDCSPLTPFDLDDSGTVFTGTIQPISLLDGFSFSTRVSRSPLFTGEAGIAHTVTGFVSFTNPCDPLQINEEIVLALISFGVVTVAEGKISEVSGAMIGLVGLMQISCLVLLAYLFKKLYGYRRTRPVVHAQGNVLLIMVIFAAVAIIGTFTLVTTSPLTCLLRRWLIELPMTGLFALMCVRVWRFDQVFKASQKCQRVKIRTRQVILRACVIITPMFLVTVVRQLHDPVVVEQRRVGNNLEESCSSRNHFLYTTLTSCLMFCILVLSIFAAKRSSRLVDRFNEGQSMAKALYVGAITAAIFFPTTQISTVGPTTLYFLTTVLVVLVVTSLCAALLLPKIRLVSQELAQMKKADEQTFPVSEQVALQVQLLGDLLPRFTFKGRQAQLDDLEQICEIAKMLQVRIAETQNKVSLSLARRKLQKNNSNDSLLSVRGLGGLVGKALYSARGAHSARCSPRNRTMNRSGSNDDSKGSGGSETAKKPVKNFSSEVLPRRGGGGSSPVASSRRKNSRSNSVTDERKSRFAVDLYQQQLDSQDQPGRFQRNRTHRKSAPEKKISPIVLLAPNLDSSGNITVAEGQEVPLTKNSLNSVGVDEVAASASLSVRSEVELVSEMTGTPAEEGPVSHRSAVPAVSLTETVAEHHDP